MPTMVAPSLLENLQARVRACTRCPLHQGRKCAVPGVGPTPARLMIVGEAPGENEDKLGLPFVGQAGELLDAMIDALNLTVPEIFITNAVKCRPPGNREPKAVEIQACKPFLLEEIRLANPTFILTVGAIGYQALTGRAFKADAGHMQQIDGRGILPTYHPAATFYTPALKIRIAKHLDTLKAWMGTLALGAHLALSAGPMNKVEQPEPGGRPR